MLPTGGNQRLMTHITKQDFRFNPAMDCINQTS